MTFLLPLSIGIMCSQLKRIMNIPDARRIKRHVHEKTHASHEALGHDHNAAEHQGHIHDHAGHASHSEDSSDSDEGMYFIHISLYL